MQSGTVMPHAVWLENEAYSLGWELINNLDGDSLDRSIRENNWNFFFVAGGISAMSWGPGNGVTARCATIRALAKTKLNKFNCFEITEVCIRHFLGIPYVVVVGHSRHAQEGNILESSERRSQQMQDVASGLVFGKAAVLSHYA